MKNLIDQPQSINLAGCNWSGFISGFAAKSVDFFSELAGGLKIGENHIPCFGEEKVIELVLFASAA